MARKRMIDPNIWQSEDFSKLSTLAKLIFIGLFSNADDEGRGRSKPVYIKSVIFPYDEVIRVADIEKSLDEIAANMSTTFYNCNGNEYYSLYNWDKWQRVDKPQPSNIPGFDDNCEVIRGTIAEQSPNNRRTVPPNRIEENRKEVSIKENKESVFELFAKDDLKLLTALNDFKQMRKDIGKKMTDRACELLCKRLEKLKADREDIVELLNKSTQNSWLDVYPSKDGKKPVKQSSGRYDFSALEKKAFEAVNGG